MSALAVVLIVLAAVLLVLVAGGIVAVRRRTARHAQHRAERIARADGDLAAAYAADNGWDRATLEAAARDAFTLAHPGEHPAEVALVGVVDLPGTDEDQAVFEVVSHGHAHRLTLGRTAGTWRAV